MSHKFVMHQLWQDDPTFSCCGLVKGTELPLTTACQDVVTFFTQDLYKLPSALHYLDKLK